MATIDIETLGPTAGPSPRNQYDPISGAGYVMWKPGDEALVMFRIPYGVTRGSRIALLFGEMIPAVGPAYSWDVETRILPAASSADLAPQAPYTSSTHFSNVDPSLEGSTVSRFISLVDEHGMISGCFPDSGDTLCVRIMLVNVSPDQSPLELATFSFRMELSVDASDSSVDCVGRVASIIRATRDLFNEENGGFLRNDFILRSINECLRDLAREDYWLAEKTLPAVAGETVTDLQATIPDLNNVLDVRFSDSKRTVKRIDSLEDFLERSTNSPASGAPEWRFIRNGVMKVCPAPGSNLDAGFHVYYSRLPPSLGCSEDNCDPPVPPAHDTVFIMFALRQAFLRDKNAPGADLKFQEYSRLYEIEKRRLLGRTEPASLIVKPGR